MTTSAYVLFAAVLGQLVLTIVLYMTLVQVRFKIAADPAARKPEMAYDQAAWPPQARQVSNAVISQFELPVLFYAGALFAFQFNATGWAMAGFAWLFVALRVVHAVIHTGKNVVMNRFRTFLAGFSVLLIFWALLAAHVFAPQAFAG